jgi:antitoxin YefM
MSKEVSYSDAREHFKDYLDYVTHNSDTIIVTRKNGDDVVMMSRKDYDSLEETLYLLSSPKTRERLLKALNSKEKGVTFKSKKDLNKFFDNL